MKKLVFVLSIFLVSASFSHLQAQFISIDVISGNRPPAPNEVRLMRMEENRHPDITKAMHDIEKSMAALHNAHDDFGGHKAQAEADLRAAYISLRKALYFRIWH
jgi:hypothetical protein